MNPRRRSAAAIAAGSAAAFVAAVWAIRAIRPALLLDPEPGWAAQRLVLALAVIAAAAGAAGVAGGILAGVSRWSAMDPVLEPLPFSRRAVATLAVAAVLWGGAVRLAWIEQVPWALWVDDLSLVRPAQELKASAADFSDPVRPAPFGVPHPFGTVGVAYLELWRLALRLWGATVFGIRFPSLAAGVLSLLTAALLGRLLLPRGGGAAAALVLAGLRWSVILSRWGWVAIAVAPILDLAALLLIAARRRRSAVLAAAAGLAAGLGTHVYLAAWIGAAALLLFALWPDGVVRPGGLRAGLALAFTAGFAVLALPLLLARPTGSLPYFARAADHNVKLEVIREQSAMPILSAAADALASPWLVSDPTPRNDIPGRSRLGWILGIPVAAILGRSLLFPRDELSGWLLCNAAAAFGSAVAAGQATLPNGFRYAYLTTVTAVAAAAGTLWLLGFTSRRHRRAWAAAAIGLLAVGSLQGARDAVLAWGASREAFDGFHGQDTLVARAAARWDTRGVVEVASDVGFDPATHSPITIGVIRRYRLDPAWRPGPPAGAWRAARAFRVVRPGTRLLPAERVVERVADAWGRETALVLGRPATGP